MRNNWYNCEHFPPENCPITCYVIDSNMREGSTLIFFFFNFHPLFKTWNGCFCNYSTCYS